MKWLIGLAASFVAFSAMAQVTMSGDVRNAAGQSVPLTPAWSVPYGVNPPVAESASTTFTAGRAMLINTTTAGTVTLTVGGVSVVYYLALGSNVVPLAITQYVAGTAVITQAYNLP